MVYRLILSYRGGAYAGWQRQRNALAVQEVVESALGDLLGDTVRVAGASRTDAGVHARGQAAHLVSPRELPPGALVHGTNHRLPEDVRVLAVERMREGFHARYRARAKEYRYRLIRTEVLSPLDAPFAVALDRDVDLEAMRRASAALVGEHEFSAFALAGGAHRSPRRRIAVADWTQAGAEVVFRVIGDGFLRGMIRGLVGTLLEVGKGVRSPEGMIALLAGGGRGEAGPTAPARGLVLQRVLYPPGWELR